MTEKATIPPNPDAPRKPTKTEISNALKSDAGFLMIDFSYNKLVLPYEEGLAVMAAMKNAEAYAYKDSHYVIKPMGVTSPECKLISKQHYLDLKMSHLFRTKVDNTEDEL